jgi:glycosyl hydrolase family 79
MSERVRSAIVGAGEATPRARGRAEVLTALTVLIVALAGFQAGGARAAPRTAAHPPARTIAVRVDGAHPGAVIPSSFLGLSMETPVLSSAAIVAQAPALVRLMRALGPGVLRISGVSVDRTRWMASTEAPAPWQLAAIAPSDLRNLAALMSATGWRLLLGLDLGHLVPAGVLEEARAASAILGSSLAGVSIGNEPDLYTHAPSAPFRFVIGSAALRAPGWGLEQYEGEISSLRTALAGAGVQAPLYGPDTASSGWLEDYAAEQGPGLAGLAQHFYPLDRCLRGRLLKVGASVESLLGERVARRESRALAAYIRVAERHGLPLRIDEANSVACAGQPHLSDTFAAALWALDFSLIAARDGAVGVNFHGGLGACAAGGTIVSPWYSPLCTLPGGQLHARPEYYALLLLRSLEGCAFVPVAYAARGRVAVYALRAPDGSLRVVIDDMELASARSGARAPAAAWVALHVPSSYTRASVVRLTAPRLSAQHGVSFGGGSVAADGSLPAPVPEVLAGGAGAFKVRVTPASAAVVTLAGGH